MERLTKEMDTPSLLVELLRGDITALEAQRVIFAQGAIEGINPSPLLAEAELLFAEHSVGHRTHAELLETIGGLLAAEG